MNFYKYILIPVSLFLFACGGNSGTSSGETKKVSCSVRVDAVTFTCLEMDEADAKDYLTEESCGEYATMDMNTVLGSGCPSKQDSKCEVSREGKNGALYFYFEQDCAGVNPNEYMPKPSMVRSSSSGVAGSSSSNILSSSGIEITHGTFTDERDNKTYKQVTIGTQTWMAENLNFETVSNSWCYGEGKVSADSSAKNCETFGRLYDWETAKIVCPAGWHLPNRKEWQTLVRVADPNAQFTGSWYENGFEYSLDDDNVAATPLKASSFDGTDIYGFSALPGGFYDDYNDRFEWLGLRGEWWTTSQYGTDAFYRDMYVGDAGNSPAQVSENYFSKTDGRSVRCIKD